PPARGQLSSKACSSLCSLDTCASQQLLYLKTCHGLLLLWSLFYCPAGFFLHADPCFSVFGVPPVLNPASHGPLLFVSSSVSLTLKRFL
uniref:Uncharacterized protein n=1 Tax=Scleropages formosus TaxID=113540 RepID=A0A8C9SW82_SCLFO